MRITFLALGGLLLLCACEMANSRFSRESPTRSQIKHVLTTRLSSLNKHGLSPFKVSVNELGKQDLRVTYFVDELHGWAGGGGELFKTSDGGTTWQSVKVQIPSGANIGKVLFPTQPEGWLILEKTSPFVVNYRENHFWLMHTLDAGQTWQLQYDRSDAKATSLFVDDRGNGWLSGAQYDGIGRFSYLILYTADKGKNWEDLSQNLKTSVAAKKSTTPEELNDVIVGGFSFHSPKTTIITGHRDVFATDDEGKNWAQIASIEDRSDQQSAIRHFGTASDSMWFARSTDSTEGVHSGLAVEQDDHSWGEYELDGVYFADVVSLSGGEFLGCGYMKTIERSEEKSTLMTEGLVLYTSDKGRSWSIVYRNANVKSINSLASINLNHVRAVGDNGLILRL